MTSRNQKEKSTYEVLKEYLNKGYRLRIQAVTGCSISLISKVLRGEVEDKRGIIVEAYRIANEQIEKMAKDAKELAELKAKISAL
jgi:hypothetical protein